VSTFARAEQVSGVDIEEIFKEDSGKLVSGVWRGVLGRRGNEGNGKYEGHRHERGVIRFCGALCRMSTVLLIVTSTSSHRATKRS